MKLEGISAEDRLPAQEQSGRKHVGVAWGGTLLPWLGWLVALGALVNGAYSHRQQMQLQARLKAYDTLVARRDAYVGVVQALEAAFGEAHASDWASLSRSFTERERAFATGEALLPEPLRAGLWTQLHDFQVFFKEVWHLQRRRQTRGRNLTGEFVARRERPKAGLRGRQ